MAIEQRVVPARCFECHEGQNHFVDAECSQCHVPNNPDGMKHLVLLQTPAHAAAEIKRLLKVVREDRMPVDDIGIATALDPHTKEALLKEGAAFDKLIDTAKQWEAARASSGQVAGVRSSTEARR